MDNPRAYPLSAEEIISPAPLSVPALKASLGLTI